MNRRSFIKTGLIFVPSVASSAIVIPGPSAKFNAAPAVITPSYFDGLQGWWKADSYALSDMATVFDAGNEWTDQTGNGYEWKNTANFPIFRTNQINSLPAIQFSGGEAGALDTPLALTAGSPGFCIMAVTVNVTDGCLISYPDGSNCFSIGDGAANVLGIHTQCHLFDGNALGNFDTDFNSSTFSTALSGARLNVWRCNSSGTIFFYEGSTARGSAADSAGNDFTFFVMGSDGTYCVNNFTGMVAEVLVYNQDVSAANIALLYTQYFVPRYGL